MNSFNRIIMTNIVIVISIGFYAVEGYCSAPKGLSLPLNLNKISDDIVKNYEHRQTRMKEARMKEASPLMAAAKRPTSHKPIERQKSKTEQAFPNASKLYSYVVAKY